MPSFQEGIERGWWNLETSKPADWPHMLIWLAAAPREKSPDRYYLRFNLEDYPEIGPTATLWDMDSNAQLNLARWPKGTGNVAMAFRTNWKDGVALYVPWDRLALEGHQQWPAQFPGVCWKRTDTIVHYLRLTRELLRSDEYTGC